MRGQQPFHETGHRQIEERQVEAGEHVADLHVFAADAAEEHVVESAQQHEPDDPPENRHEGEADRDQPAEHGRADQHRHVVAHQRPAAREGVADVD